MNMNKVETLETMILVSISKKEITINKSNMNKLIANELIYILATYANETNLKANIFNKMVQRIRNTSDSIYACIEFINAMEYIGIEILMIL